MQDFKYLRCGHYREYKASYLVTICNPATTSFSVPILSYRVFF
jgi:hypothetical protein